MSFSLLKNQISDLLCQYLKFCLIFHLSKLIPNSIFSPEETLRTCQRFTTRVKFCFLISEFTACQYNMYIRHLSRFEYHFKRLLVWLPYYDNVHEWSIEWYRWIHWMALIHIRRDWNCETQFRKWLKIFRCAQDFCEQSTSNTIQCCDINTSELVVFYCGISTTSIQKVVIN